MGVPHCADHADLQALAPRDWAPGPHRSFGDQGLGLPAGQEESTAGVRPAQGDVRHVWPVGQHGDA